MPIQFIQANSIGSGARVIGVAGNDYGILQDITVGSTNDNAFISVFSHRITVEGHLIADLSAIFVGADNLESTISVGADGLVSGRVGGILATGILTVSNHGRIAAMAGDAIAYSGDDRVFITNHGVIEGAGDNNGDGVAVNDASSAALINYGRIAAGDGLFNNNSYAYFGSSVGVDQIFNRGEIIGQISLNGGNDFYDGQLGQIINLGTGGRGRLLAGDGQDLVIGGVLGEEFFGEAGTDILQGRGGDDILNGGLDNDQLFGGDNNDSLVGGGSNDYLDGQGEDDEVYGGDNNDTLFGNHGNDYLDGQGENDLIDGGFGNDIIRGNIGQDQMVGGAGSDTMTGGVGDDQFRFFASDLENGRRDVITDFAEAGGNADLLVFFDGIQASNVTTSQAGGDVIVRITYASGTAVHEIVVENFLVAQLADQIFFL